MTILLWYLAGCDSHRDCPVQHRDLDGDGFGDPYATARICEETAGWAEADGDCDDTRPGVNPSAFDACNGVDDNCDGVVDPFPAALYFDGDGDGYGGESLETCIAFATSAAVTIGGDCDDADAAVHPDVAHDVCDGIDENCSGEVDEDAYPADGSIFWFDGDGDGQGNQALRGAFCSVPPGWVDNFSDCDDQSAKVYFGSGCPPLPVGETGSLDDWPNRVTGKPGYFGGRLLGTGDIDGDGMDDLGVLPSGGDGLFVYRGGWAGNLDGDLGAYTTFAEPISYDLAAAPRDVNGDGQSDLALQSVDGLRVFHGPLLPGVLSSADADLTLTTPNLAFTRVVNGGDVDADDRPDIWVLDLLGIVSRMDGSAVGSASTTGAASTIDAHVSDAKLAAVDLDGDGLAELALGREYEGVGGIAAPGAVWIVAPPFEGAQDADLNAQTRLYGNAPGVRAGAGVTGGADLDGDGRSDLVVAAHSDWVALVTAPEAGDSLIVESCDALFVSASADLTAEEVVGLTLPGDLDGDGWDDLAISAVIIEGTVPYPSVLVVEGPIGSGTFDFTGITAWRASPGGDALFMASGDLDGDGWGEVAAGALDLGWVAVGP